MKKTVAVAGVIIFLFTLWILNTGQDVQQPVIKEIKSSQQEQIVLRFGHNTPEESALHQAALRYAELVAEKTQGKVKVTIYPAQQLGNDHQMVEMARNGELDLLLTPTAKMSVPVPSMQYADLPFYFPSREDLYAMLDGEPGQMLFQDMAKIGLVGMAFWENGFKHFTANKPILTPEDFASTKIRVMKSQIIMDQFRAFDAEPVPIDFHSTRQALVDHVVDGQENPLIAIVSMGFHEVQSDLTLSEHAYLGYVFSVSEKVLKQLPQQIQQALIMAAKEVTPWERAETQRREAELLEKVQQAGVRIHRLSPEAREAFAKRTRNIVKRAEQIIGPAIISRTNELLREKYAPPPAQKAKLIIGINADLSQAPGAGLAIKRGVQLAVDEINREGGLLGKEVEVIARDHRITATLGQANMKYFIERPDVLAVVGGKHSAVVVSEMDIVQEAGIPYLIPWAASSKITQMDDAENFIFRNSANDDLASSFIAKEALKRFSNPAILVEKTVWGRGNLERIQSYLNKQGKPIVSSVVFNLGQDNFDQDISGLLRSGADGFIVVANAREGAQILNSIGRLKPSIPVVSHWGILGGRLWEKNADLLKKMDLSFFQTFHFDSAKNSVAERLAEQYEATYAISSEKMPAPNGVVQAYDLVKMLAVAVEQAGTDERQAIKAALENLPPLQGAIKRYAPAFTESNHDALTEKDFLMAQFNDAGQIVPSEQRVK